MRKIRKILHAAYTGSTDSDGYPTGDSYGSAVERDSYGWFPLTSQLSLSGEYDSRVVTSQVVMVPDPSAYKPRDQVTLPGQDVYFVSEDVRNYEASPYDYLGHPNPPGGEIVVEKISG